MTAADEFTVEPADATCTATTETAGVTPSVTAGSAADKRIVSVAAAAPFSHEVTVSCDATGRTATEATATLAAKVAIGTITVASGTACAASSGTTDYVCTVPREGGLSVSAIAQGAHSGLSIGWAGAGGATVGTPTQTAVAPVPGVGFSRTSTTTLSCTADGTVTVTVTAADTTRTVTIGVTCDLSVACDDPLGSLAAGTTTRSGTIAVSAACTSPQRNTSSSSTFYARRHTFTLDLPATVTVDLGSASSNATRLDTYLLLVAGHNAGAGTVEGRDDNSGPGTDSRITGKRLAAGDYTVEATTSSGGSSGAYDLSINTVFDPAVRSVTVTSRGVCEPDDDAPPQGIDAVLECEVTSGRTAPVAATAVATHATIGLAWAATGSASVTAAATPTATAILGAGNVATGDWQTTTTADVSCTADGTVTLTATAGPTGSTDTHTTRLVVDCVNPVTITGLDDATDSGTGAVTLSDTFTVSPTTAECTAAPVGTVTKPTGGVAASRVLTASFTSPAKTTVTVTCTNDGYADGVDDALFTHAGAVTSVTVTAASGGTCTASATTPAGVNTAQDCTMGDDAPLVLSTTAQASAYGPSLTWTLGTGLSRVRSTQAQRPSPHFAPGGVFAGWQRTGTLTLDCTADGAATLTASLPDAPSHLTRVNVDCQETVEIDGLADTAQSGSGTVTVSDDFTVTPAAAACTATAATGTPTVTAGTGSARTVSLDVTAGSSVDVTVTCTQSGYADGVVIVALSAVAPGRCGDDLGVIGVGSVSRSGTIAAVSGCHSPQHRRDGGTSRLQYARRHTFTTLVPLSVTIDHKSAPSNARPLDTYLLLIKGHSTNGQGKVLGRNDDRDLGAGDRNSQLANVELPPGKYTIEATTYNYFTTGDYVVTVTATAGGACISDLGTLGANRYTASGTVAAAVACASAHRGTADSRPHARWHTFTLAAPAWVDIDLAKATSSTLDPYVLLFEGTDVSADGTVLAQDDSSGTGTAAQIRGRYLEAGTYTIEATASTATGNAATGAYDLTVTVPIHGLPQQIDAIVDEQTTINFTYWPTGATLGLASSSENLAELAESQGVFAVAAGGAGVMYASPQLADRHSLTVGRSVPSASGQSGNARSGARSAPPSSTSPPSPREFSVDIAVGCAVGQPVSAVNGRLCLRPPSGSTTPPLSTHQDQALDGLPLYRVTEGALAGTRWAAVTARDRYLSTGAQCDNISVNHLIALMLSISYWEVPVKDENQVNRRWLARSPMALSRKDYQGQIARILDQEVERREDNSAQYAGGDWRLAPKRAFWHPGVGLWQLDDTFDSGIVFEGENVRHLDHSERANTYVGGRYVAYKLLQVLCGPVGALSDTDIDRAFQPWGACKVKQLDGSFTYPCRVNSYDNIFDLDSDELYVTTQDYRGSALGPDGGYGDATSISGGLISTQCRWGQTGLPFGCHVYDVSNREGQMQVFSPNGAVVRDADGDIDANKSSSPLASGFISFTDKVLKQKFVVFSLSNLIDSSSTWIRAVPDGRHSRLPEFGWQQTDYAVNGRPGLVLYVKVCGTQQHNRFEFLCKWVSVNGDPRANRDLRGQLDTVGWTNRTDELPRAP